jgi:hypothetical protein
VDPFAARLRVHPRLDHAPQRVVTRKVAGRLHSAPERVWITDDLCHIVLRRCESINSKARRRTARGFDSEPNNVPEGSDHARRYGQLDCDRFGRHPPASRQSPDDGRHPCSAALRLSRKCRDGQQAACYLAALGAQQTSEEFGDPRRPPRWTATDQDDRCHLELEYERSLPKECCYIEQHDFHDGRPTLRASFGRFDPTGRYRTVCLTATSPP